MVILPFDLAIFPSFKVRNSPWSQKRAKSLQKAVSACANCYEMESLGLESDRQTFNSLYANEIENLLTSTDENGRVPEKSLTFLEIKLSNKYMPKYNSVLGHKESILTTMQTWNT